MRIAISSQLDEMNLSPEAYRLYCYLRCEMARQEAVNSAFGGIRPDFCVDGLTLNLHREITDILNKCRIEYHATDESLFRVFDELIKRSIIIIDHEFILVGSHYEFYIESVTFTAEEEWQ